MRRYLLVALGLGVLSAFVVCLLNSTPPLRNFEGWSYDWRVNLRGNPILDPLQAPTHIRNPDIVVVPIDEKTIRNIPEPMVLWVPHFAAVIGGLVDAGASVVALDYMFVVSAEEHLQQVAARVLDQVAQERGMEVEPSRALPLIGGDDMRLFNALRSGRVVLMSFLREDGTVERGHPRFAWGAGIENLGLVNTEPDQDGVVRRQPLYKTTVEGGSDEVLLSFDLVTARHLADAAVDLDPATGQLKLGGQVMPHDPAYRITVNWMGPPGTFRSQWSFVDLVERAAQGDREFFESQFGGKAVLIGPYFAGSSAVDLARTPYHVADELEMFGIEVHANTLNTIVNADFVQPAQTWVGPALVVLLGIAMAMLCFALRPLPAAGALLAIALTVVAVSLVLLTRFNLWLEVAAPLVCLPVCFALVYTYRYLSEDRERRHVRALLGRYVSESVAENILRDPSALELGGTRAEVSILFCDINGFTAMSESSRPEAVIEILNDYFTRMEHVIFKHGATLKQFVGDEIMVICGAPRADPDHPVTACRLALDMVDELRRWRAERQAAGLGSFDVKFGLHCGEVIVGNVGSPHRAEYAAVGDVVNTASRVMALSARAGALLLVSETMHHRVNDQFETRKAGSFPVKGKTEELTVYELVAERKAPPDETLHTLD